MKNQVLTSHCKPLFLLGIFAIALSACSSSDDDTDLSNSAPSVSAGEDQTVNQGATVNLTGVASDSDGSISSWLWQQTSGSPSVTIKNSTTSNASFAAPEVDAETTLVFELEVKDNDGASVSDSMRVTVLGPGDSVNPLPSDFKAEAGDAQVTLSWSHYSSATDYNIYRSSASDCELANYTSCANGALFTSKSSGFTDDTGLSNGTTYYYWIEAILDGVTYLDGAAISATPVADEDDNDIDLTDGLVAHYEFEGNANDSSGNDNDGEEYGGVSYTDGALGKAVSFDGVDDFIEIADSSDLDLLTFSVVFWTKTFHEDIYKSHQVWINKSGWGEEHEGYNVNYTFGHRQSLEAGFEESDGTDNTVTMPISSLSDGGWDQIVMTYNGAELVVLINLQEVGSLSTTAFPELSSYPLRLARNGNDSYSNIFLKTIMDDLRIYNRALNTSEIQALYELGESSVDLDDGLVAHYEFEGNAYDSSGNSNDGSEYGGVSYTDGVLGKAVSFDGVDDFIEIADSSDLDLLTFSVVFWTKTFHEDVYKSHQVWVNKSGWGEEYEGYNVNYTFGHRQSLEAGFEESDGTDNTVTMPISSLSDGGWDQIVMTYNGTELAVLINLQEVGSLSTTAFPELSSYPLRLARNGNDSYSNIFLKTIMDDLRIYNRALNTSEIQALYELGESSVDLDDGLVAHYEFEGNAYDSSGNSNDGSEYGGVSYTDGVLGKAVSFDGVDDFIEIADSSDLDLLTFSVVFWTKTFHEDVYKSHQVWVNKSGWGEEYEGYNVNYTFGHRQSLEAGFEESDGTDNTVTMPISSLSDGGWDQIVMTYNGTELAMLINLQEVGSLSTTASPELSSYPLRLARNGNDSYSNIFLKTIMDDLRIYDRALNAAEIQALYELDDD